MQMTGDRGRGTGDRGSASRSKAEGTKCHFEQAPHNLHFAICHFQFPIPNLPPSAASCPELSQSERRTLHRREWFRGVARCVALGGITLLSAGLILKNRVAPAQQCRPETIAQTPSEQASLCRDCAVLTQCALPQAAAARKPSEG